MQEQPYRHLRKEKQKMIHWMRQERYSQKEMATALGSKRYFVNLTTLEKRAAWKIATDSCASTSPRERTSVTWMRPASSMLRGSSTPVCASPFTSIHLPTFNLALSPGPLSLFLQFLCISCWNLRFLVFKASAQNQAHIKSPRNQGLFSCILHTPPQ